MKKNIAKIKKGYYNETMTNVIDLGTSSFHQYLIPCGDGYCLMDTGYPWQKKAFLKKMEEKGITNEQIKYIVITHMHADHTGFLKEMLELTNAQLIYDVRDKQRLEAGKNNLNTYISRFDYLVISKVSAAMVDLMQSFPAVFYDNYVDARTQPLEEYGIRFLALEGHTEHDLCVRFEDKIFCGDLCMRGFGSSKYAPMWIYNKYQLLDSWQTLLSCEEPYLYPVHGDPFPRTKLQKSIDFWRDRGVFKLYPKKQ